MSGASNKKAWRRTNTTRPQTKTNGAKSNAPAASAASGFNRELLPEPVTYYEAQGLTLQGPLSAQWRTAGCRFHGGSDSLRIKVSTGAFVCMACGVKGRDVLSYHQQAHGLDFLAAAKQLNAWIDDGKPHHRSQKPAALPAREALCILRDEVTLIAIEGARLARGIKPDELTLRRLLRAAGRVNLIAEGI